MPIDTLYFSDHDHYPSTYYFHPGLFENQRRGMVYPSSGVHSDGVYIRTFGASPIGKKNVSIVICTYGRPESLNDTLESLCKQTFKNFEVILLTEKGNLSELRDKGLRSACGDIVCFIDDDVYCPPDWLQGVTQSFREGVVGVTGPTRITEQYQKNRDCLKYRKLKKIQDWVFRVPSNPGTLSECGAPSMASNYEICRYEGEVQYLECCNMSVKKKEAIDVGGFDHHYYRTSEWCELDLSFKLRQKGQLRFAQNCQLYHRPSKAGIYKERLATKHRWDNFIYFQRKWVKSSFLTYTYRAFIWTYLKMKERRMI